jgi:proteasome assembly chaperone (PAC2) family protein
VLTVVKHRYGGRVASNDALQWFDRPSLDQPVVVAAFKGWNDAGDSASTAADYLAERWLLDPFAEIDPEEFFDFAETRPEVRLDDGGGRVIDWPENRFLAGTVPGTTRDVVILTGTEPQLRWRTFAGLVAEVAEAVGAALVVTLGALLTDIPHSRPTSVIGTAEDDDLVDRLELRRSTYEGPTGIVGVLGQVCRSRGLPTVSLWGAVPSYVPGSPSPKAQLALIERTARLLEVGVATTELEIATAEYERQIDSLVEDDDESTDYVAGLERAYDAAELEDDSDTLVDEVERFLRER